MAINRKMAAISSWFFLSAFFSYMQYKSNPSYVIQSLYFIPVFLVIWYVNPVAGVFAAFIDMAGWISINGEIREINASHGVILWNWMRALVFLLFSFILSQIKYQLDTERRHASIDPLTDLANRRAFLRGAEREISRAARSHNPLAVAFLDIDDFKQFNDSGGHDQGDSLLTLVGEVLKLEVRSIDIAARLGGDEFVILLPEIKPKLAREVVKRIQERLASAMHQRGWNVTFSVGMAVFTEVPSGVNELLRQADRSMYQAKKDGKDNMRYTVIGR